MRRLAISALLTVLLAGCGGDDKPTGFQDVQTVEDRVEQDADRIGRPQGIEAGRAVCTRDNQTTFVCSVPLSDGSRIEVTATVSEDGSRYRSKVTG